MIKKLSLFLGIIIAFSFKIAPVPSSLSNINIHKHPSGDPVNFTLKDIKGKKVSLSDYRGKFVVIDFWASWCIPCREEMPSTQKLSFDFADNDKLVFLYISFDEDEQAWKNAVKKDGDDNGIQLIAGDKNEDLKSMFNMDEIPHFAWVNSKGVIVKKDAPRPSEFGTKATLKAYILADS